MTVLTIRSSRRYAVRQTVRLRKPGARAASGLLIELSAEGCRISGVERGRFAMGEALTLEFEDLRLPGFVRWAHDGIVGLRLEAALHPHELADMIARGRGSDELPRYGT
jgi:hypothetical protein